MNRRLSLLLAAVLLVLVPASAARGDTPDPAGQIEVAMSGPATPPAEGEPAVATLRATRSGDPVPGLTVVFVRRSTDTAPEGETSTAVTDEDGTARLEFPLAGPTTVSASVYDEAGEHVSTVTVTTGVVCRCTPPAPRVRAVGRDARNGDDRVLVETGLPSGAVLDLFRITPDGKRAERIRRNPVDEAGRRAWRVTDHNGRRPTRYFVVARPTESSPAQRTPVLRIR